MFSCPLHGAVLAARSPLRMCVGVDVGVCVGVECERTSNRALDAGGGHDKRAQAIKLRTASLASMRTGHRTAASARESVPQSHSAPPLPQAPAAAAGDGELGGLQPQTGFVLNLSVTTGVTPLFLRSRWNSKQV